MTDTESNRHAARFDLAPVAIDRDGETAIVIRWSDDSETRWLVRELRDACPCATCREKKKSEDAEKSEAPGKPAMLPILSAAEARPLRIEGMKPVGSYAYGIEFSDGHSSGIFTFEMLHSHETG